MIAPPASGIAAGLEWLLVGLAGAALGALLGRLVGLLVEGGAAGSRRRLPWLGAAFACALWGWEVVAGGQLPHLDAVTVVPRSAVAARFAAHLVLATFLAAAAWVDLRHRVIPDAITVPGVLLGLLWTGLDPEVLPVVPRLLPRSFATPLVELDILGAFGGLRSVPLPTVLGGAGGLVVAFTAFVGWWLACTEPGIVEGRPGIPRWLRDPRTWVLLVGGAAITVAWARGGLPWAGQLASLVGLVVAAGLVWLTRLGASWALDQEALGFGDVTLMAMAGSWLGWQACVLAFFVAVFIGLAHGVGQLATGRGNELPFGPSLCAGLAIVVVAWNPLWQATGPYFERPGELTAVGGAVILLTALSLAAWRRLRNLLPPA